MNLLIGILILFLIIAILGKLFGFVGSTISTLLMVLFVLGLFFITVGYAFL